jgi:hypothetical protein
VGLKLYATLYHGSGVSFDEVDLSYGQNDSLEFGPGFYATPDFEKAEEYAKIAFFDTDADEVYIHEFEFDYEEATKTLRYLEFEVPNIEWYHFVQANLRGDAVPEYDFVCGPLESEGVWRILSLVEEGSLSLNEALDILSQISLSMQIAIKTEAAKAYLTKLDTVIIVRKEQR